SAEMTSAAASPVTPTSTPPTTTAAHERYGRSVRTAAWSARPVAPASGRTSASSTVVMPVPPFSERRVRADAPAYSSTPVLREVCVLYPFFRLLIPAAGSDASAPPHTGRDRPPRAARGRTPD